MNPGRDGIDLAIYSGIKKNTSTVIPKCFFMIWCQFYIAEDLSEFKPRFRGDNNIMGIGQFLGHKFVTVKPNTGDYFYKDSKFKRYKAINVVYDHELSRSLRYECYHVQLLRDWSYDK